MIRESCDGSLGCRRIADHLDDLRERGILTDSGRAALKEARLVQGRGLHLIADRLVDRQTLTGQRSFVHRTCARNYKAVHRDILARLYAEDVADPDTVDRNRDFFAVSYDPRGLRRELHERL